MTRDPKQKLKPTRRARKIERRPRKPTLIKRTANTERRATVKTTSLWQRFKQLFHKPKPLGVQRVNKAAVVSTGDNIGVLPSIDWSEPNDAGERRGYGEDGNLYVAYQLKLQRGFAVTRILAKGATFYMGIYNPLP